MSGYPNDPELRGLAAVTFHSDTPPWEFDICTVAEGHEPLPVSDWHSRYGRASRKNDSSGKAAKALIPPSRGLLGGGLGK